MPAAPSRENPQRRLDLARESLRQEREHYERRKSTFDKRVNVQLAGLASTEFHEIAALSEDILHTLRQAQEHHEGSIPQIRSLEGYLKGLEKGASKTPPPSGPSAPGPSGGAPAPPVLPVESHGMTTGQVVERIPSLPGEFATTRIAAKPPGRGPPPEAAAGSQKNVSTATSKLKSIRNGPGGSSGAAVAEPAPRPPAALAPEAIVDRGSVPPRTPVPPPAPRPSRPAQIERPPIEKAGKLAEAFGNRFGVQRELIEPPQTVVSKPKGLAARILSKYGEPTPAEAVPKRKATVDLAKLTGREEWPRPLPVAPISQKEEPGIADKEKRLREKAQAWRAEERQAKGHGDDESARDYATRAWQAETELAHIQSAKGPGKPTTRANVLERAMQRVGGAVPQPTAKLGPMERAVGRIGLIPQEQAPGPARRESLTGRLTARQQWGRQPPASLGAQAAVEEPPSIPTSAQELKTQLPKLLRQFSKGVVGRTLEKTIPRMIAAHTRLTEAGLTTEARRVSAVMGSEVAKAKASQQAAEDQLAQAARAKEQAAEQFRASRTAIVSRAGELESALEGDSPRVDDQKRQELQAIAAELGVLQQEQVNREARLQSTQSQHQSLAARFAAQQARTQRILSTLGSYLQRRGRAT